MEKRRAHNLGEKSATTKRPPDRLATTRKKSESWVAKKRIEKLKIKSSPVKKKKKGPQFQKDGTVCNWELSAGD